MPQQPSKMTKKFKPTTQFRYHPSTWSLMHHQSIAGSGRRNPWGCTELNATFPLLWPRCLEGAWPSTSHSNQCNSAHWMRLVLSQLQAHMLPLMSVHFGSCSSHHSFHCLHEAIPQSALQQFFPDYKTHADLAKAISTVWANRRKEPNCWQTHISCIWWIRQLLDHFIQAAHDHVRNHGYLDGLKEYVIQHDIKFWHADPQGGGLFYTFEHQYLYGLCQFLTREEYPELAMPPTRNTLSGLDFVWRGVQFKLQDNSVSN